MLDLEKYLSTGQTVTSNLLLKNHHRIGLRSEEFLFVLQLCMAQLEGDTFPDLQMIAINMGIRQDQILQILDRSVTDGFAKIETTNANGRRADRYDLYPICDQPGEYLKTQEKKYEEEIQGKEIQSVYQLFEQKFGHPPFSIEFQRVGRWLEEDYCQPEILKLTLWEAILNQAHSPNYIDRILLSWERKNLRAKQ